MVINEQLSRYQAEFYVESAHDAFVNVQETMSQFNSNIAFVNNAIEEEILYRRKTKKERMKSWKAKYLLRFALLMLLLSLVSIAFAGYLLYGYIENSNYDVNSYDLHFFIALGVFLVAFILFIFLLKKRNLVGKRLNIKNAHKKLKKEKKYAKDINKVLLQYPQIYEGIQKVSLKTKRYLSGKIRLTSEDIEAINNVKAFVSKCEETNKKYKNN